VLPIRGVRVQIPSAAPSKVGFMESNKLEKKQKYQREWMRSRRQEWVQENGPCRHCGTWEQLEVDHINPALKTMHTGSIWSRTLEARQKELDNCQVLCKSCHLKKTIAERPKPVHGSITMYDDYKCRCDLCREIKRKTQMKLRNPKKYKEIYGNE
jgi:hypothetical protein